MTVPPICNYDRLRSLKIDGWYSEIVRLCRQSMAYDLGLYVPDKNTMTIGDLKSEAGSFVHFGGPYVPFIANVSLPDGPLYIEFERWLSEVRKQIRPNVSKPGPIARNSIFDGLVFNKWMDSRIVEFADLLAWRATLAPSERKTWSEARLGRHIGRASSKDVNTTKRILREALASLPSLGAQVEYDMTRTPEALNAIASHIAAKLNR